jgi:hypothetical protein
MAVLCRHIINNVVELFGERYNFITAFGIADHQHHMPAHVHHNFIKTHISKVCTCDYTSTGGLENFCVQGQLCLVLWFQITIITSLLALTSHEITIVKHVCSVLKSLYNTPYSCIFSGNSRRIPRFFPKNADLAPNLFTRPFLPQNSPCVRRDLIFACLPGYPILPVI